MKKIYLILSSVLSAILAMLANDLIIKTLPSNMPSSIYIYKIIAACFVAMLISIGFIAISDKKES